MPWQLSSFFTVNWIDITLGDLLNLNLPFYIRSNTLDLHQASLGTTLAVIHVVDQCCSMRWHLKFTLIPFLCKLAATALKRLLVVSSFLSPFSLRAMRCENLSSFLHKRMQFSCPFGMKSFRSRSTGLWRWNTLPSVIIVIAPLWSQDANYARHDDEGTGNHFILGFVFCVLLFRAIR